MTSDPYLYSFRVERNNEIGNELRWMPREGKEKTRNGLHFLGRKLHARNEGWILESTRVRKRIQSWNVGKKEEGNGVVFSRCAGSRCRSEAVDLRRLITNLCAGRIGRYSATVISAAVGYDALQISCKDLSIFSGYDIPLPHANSLQSPRAVTTTLPIVIPKRLSVSNFIFEFIR